MVSSKPARHQTDWRRPRELFRFDPPEALKPQTLINRSELSLVSTLLAVGGAAFTNDALACFLKLQEEAGRWPEAKRAATAYEDAKNATDFLRSSLETIREIGEIAGTCRVCVGIGVSQEG